MFDPLSDAFDRSVLSQPRPPTSAASGILVAGFGNPDRGDDAVGIEVALALALRRPVGVVVRSMTGDPLALIDAMHGFDGLICVDAASSLGQPGRVHRFDLRVQSLPAQFAFMSSHAFGLAQVISLACALGCAPARIIVYAIEAYSFHHGAPISTAVARAIPSTVNALLAELKSFAS